MNVFNWRLWKWRNWCDLEDLAIIRGTWSVKTFVFVFSFSHSWVIGNTVLLKGVEVKLRKTFQVMLISKSYTYQSFRVKPLEISYSSANFFSDRDEDLLFFEFAELGCGIVDWASWGESVLRLHPQSSNPSRVRGARNPTRTNYSENRRSSSLSMNKLTELYEISNGFTRRDW